MSFEVPHWFQRTVFYVYLVVVVACTPLVLWTALQARQAAHENRNRIAEIQAAGVALQEARASSCRQTYEAIRLVFKPFIPKNPDPAQQDRIDKFNERIDKFKSNCGAQTRPRNMP